MADTVTQLERSNTMTVVTPAGINTLLIDANPNRRAATCRVLGRLGYCVIESSGSLRNIDLRASGASIGAVVIGATNIDDDLIDQIRALRADANVPVLVLSEDANTDHINDAVSAGVNAYEVIGVNGNRIKAGIDLALANHRTMVELQRALAAAREDLEARKVIEKAKGIVMKSKGLDEASAYNTLRQMAMKRGVKLIDVARTLTDAVELLR